MPVMSVRSAAHRFLLPTFISLLPVSLLCECVEADGDDPVGALATREEGEIYAGNRFAATSAPLYPEHEGLVDRTDIKIPVIPPPLSLGVAILRTFYRIAL
jgi:hypothetical protein